jgi:hypothetical protein
VLVKEPAMPENTSVKQDLVSKYGLVFFKQEESGEKFFQEYIKSPIYK